MPLIPFGAWTPDLPAHQNEGVTDLENCIPQARGYRGMPTLVPTTNALTGRCLGMWSAIDTAGNAYNFAADATDLYKRASNVWEVASSATAAYSVADKTTWCMTQFANDVIAVAEAEDPQYFEIGSSSSFATLSATAPQARHCAVVNDFLVMGHITSNPRRVQWSAIRTPRGVWTSSLETLAGSQDLAGHGGFVQAIVGGHFGVVFQEYAVWRMVGPSVPEKFSFQRIEDEQGTPAPRSVVKKGEVIYYLGQDGWYMTNGAGPSVAIGKNQIDEEFFGDVDITNFAYVVGKADPSEPIIWWIYPSVNSNGVPDKVLYYDIVNRKWGRGSQDLEWVGLLRADGLTMETMDAIYTNLDLVPFSLDSPVLAGGRPEMSGFDTAHKSGAFNGSHGAWSIVTGQLQPVPGKRALLQNMRPIIDSATPENIACNVAPKTRTNDDTSFLAADIDVNDEGDCPVLASGRYFRFKAAGTGNMDNAHGIDIDQWSEDGDH